MKGIHVELAASRWVQGALLLLWGAGVGAWAGTGVGTSRTLTIDTRWVESGGCGESGGFTVDTRAMALASVALTGRVTDAGGVGLAGVKVEAIAAVSVAGATTTDAQGNYALPLLPPGAYWVRATRSGFKGEQGAVQWFAANGVGRFDFRLAALPPALVVLPVTRPLPEPPQTVDVGQMQYWTGKAWTESGLLDPAKTTIVLTHGWNSSPEVWASGMATNLTAAVGSGANIVAWDWRAGAGTGLRRLSQAFYRTPKQGRALGQRLAEHFPANRPPLHFIGHSLGTLVNATAADYLHQEASPVFDWQKTHMTLLDNAVLANVEAGVEEVVDLATDDLVWLLQEGVVWHTPDQSAWVDNYISLVGINTLEGVNAYLGLGPEYLKGWDRVDPRALHGYACGWYTKSVADPAGSPLGFRYSFEQLGHSPSWPTPSPYWKGYMLEQDSLTEELSLGAIHYTGGNPVNYLVRRHLNRGYKVASRGVVLVGGALYGVVNGVGSVVVGVADEMAEVGEAAWNLVVNLGTKVAAVSPLQQHGWQPMGDNPTNSPAFCWIPVTVPTNASTLTFTFMVEGEVKSDSFVCGMNGTNLLEVEAAYVPRNVPMSSGPLDVRAWRGEEVELHLGIVGGTSTNAVVTARQFRFNEALAPALRIAKDGDGAVLAWPITATGLVLESTAALGTTNGWTVVTNGVSSAGFEQVVTNAVSETEQYYRLRAP